MGKKKRATWRETVILGILGGEECYGREIRGEYQARTGRPMPVGSLYVTLARMMARGLLAARIGEQTHKRGGNRRKYFRLTAAGRRALAESERALHGPGRPSLAP